MASNRQTLQRGGVIKHEFVVFQEDGVGLSYPYKRWRYVIAKGPGGYREPYSARHSWIYWVS